MRLIIAGGRDRHITPYEIDYELRRLGWNPTRLVNGKAPGVDAAAWLWAQLHGIPVDEFPAAWVSEGRKSGPLRNERMAQNADALLAFPSPNSRGTLDMIRRARKYNLAIEVIA